MKITVIGAGPIGCYAGYLFAKSGHDVSIYEEHSDIGLPIQCTGLLTKDFDQFNIPKEKFLINTLEEVEINSPNHQAKIKIKEYLICRQKFDRYIADLAKNEGANLFLNHSFIKRSNNNDNKSRIVIKNNKTKKEIELSPDLVIAADGPLSKTSKAYGLYHTERKNYYGIQATVEGKFNAKCYKTFFGKKVCPDFFAWIVPESENIARVGLASRKSQKSYFDHFIKRNNFKILDIQAGTIPIYNPKQKLQKNNCYLVGDSSSFVKATTGGGIVPGMQQAKTLVNCINKKYDYKNEIKPLKKKMRLHLLVRKIIDNFSDKDWDRLVKIIKNKEIQQILGKNSRENLLPILIKCLIKEPRLIYFSKYLLK
jgi:digeranylgeranylglycerophospholipid reductase